MTNHKVILEVASQVRSWAEWYAKRYNNFPSNLCGMCAIASGKISHEFKVRGIEHEIRLYNDQLSHVFIAVDDHILDVTATQFQEFERTPIVFIHQKEAEQYYFYKDFAKAFKDVKELRVWQIARKWPRSQVARPVR